jgi:DNA topoisomerase-1
MVRKYSTTKTLVIVESAAKCKKIEEYLGPGYKCVASFGHLREIASLKSIDIANDFKPTYSLIDNEIKKRQYELIKKEIAGSNQVILAADNDREGEAIAYSLIELFGLPLNTKRITFNEITETAIRHAVQNPRTVDMNIVNSQQARSVLDILVGFKVSPMLWKFINKGNSLSAGRCQTPALRLIYDNYKDINDKCERKVYNVTGFFTNLNIAFELNKQFDTDEQITNYLDKSADFKHVYTHTPPKKVIKYPPEPFTTSVLQQKASNELHLSPKETMKRCQSLYEQGLITYMRTDSKSYSNEFINSAREYILKNYSDKYVNDNNNTREKGAKEAHEAIRPTDLSLKALPETVDSKDRRLYKLIWDNTLASCMSNAVLYSITANITSANNTKFSYTSEEVFFDGFKTIEKIPDNKEYQYLQTIQQNVEISYKKISARATIKGLKQHYTEARLIQLLEERGIGRPSTFSSLVDKIQERGYVKKTDIQGIKIDCSDYELENGEIFELQTQREFGGEKNKLVIQSVGIIVTEFLYKHFPQLFNYDYTMQMENELDKISKGESIWHDQCRLCNEQLEFSLEVLKDERKLEIKIDENNTYLIGKYGPVIKTTETVNGKQVTNFKSIKDDLDVTKIEAGEYNINEMVNDTSKKVINLGKYDTQDVILRKGKYGLYVAWGTNSKTLKELGNRPIESITFAEVEPFLSSGSNLVREINKCTSIRVGSKGDYIFYKTQKMKKPMFYGLQGFEKDYKICDLDILKSWMKEKHNI